MYIFKFVGVIYIFIYTYVYISLMSSEEKFSSVLCLFVLCFPSK